MSALRPAFLWALMVVAAAAGGVYLTDQLFIAPGRVLQQQLAERDAQIRVLTERNQALEAAVRLLRHTERRARLVVLDQAVVPGESQNAVVGGSPGERLRGRCALDQVRAGRRLGPGRDRDRTGDEGTGRGKGCSRAAEPKPPSEHCPHDS